MNDAPLPAFVLHRRAFGESSQILELFTRDRGRLGVLAKGIRARGRGGMQADPFQLIGVSLRGRGELPLLVRSEPLHALPAPLLNGVSSLAGLYLNELLLALLQREDPHPGLFEHYTLCMQELCGSPALALRRFEWALLRELGYAPDLLQDHQGTALDPARHYHYDPLSGLRHCSDGRWSGQMLLALQHGEAWQLGAQRRFLREQLSLLLDGQQLRSWNLLGELERIVPTV